MLNESHDYFNRACLSRIGSISNPVPPKRCGFHSWAGKIPWRRAWQPTPAFLPGESHGQRSLTGYSTEGRTESDTTEVTACLRATDGAFLGGTSGKEPICRCRRHKRLGPGPWCGGQEWHWTGNPLQYSCPQTPMDRGTWQATVHSITQSQTQLKRRKLMISPPQVL